MALDSSIYSQVRPPPSLFTQLGQQQNLQEGAQNLQLGKQRLALGQQALDSGQFEQQQRQQAIAMQQKIGEVMQKSVGPDGQPSEDLLRKNFLADPQLAGKWPDVEASIVKAKKATADLREAVQKADTTEDERVAALGAQLEAIKYDPAASAKLIQQVGPTVSPTRAPLWLKQIQQAPTPETVESIFAPIVASDKTQVANKRGAADTADLNAQADERKQKLEDDKRAKALANASKQLYQARGKADYKQRWLGLPPDIGAQFDAPPDYVEGESQKRALELGQTPDQIVQRTETAKRDAAAQAKQLADEKERALTRQATEAYRKARLGQSGTAKKDVQEERDFREWNATMSRAKSLFDAQLEAWKARNPYGNAPADDPPPAFKSPEDYPTFRGTRTEQRAPAGIAPGARVRLKNGKEVTVDEVKPDGTFTYH